MVKTFINRTARFGRRRDFDPDEAGVYKYEVSPCRLDLSPARAYGN